MKTPVNDLERAFRAAYRSESAMPEFYRRLRESELWFLMPYHPELELGMMKIEPGTEMAFESFMMKTGMEVPVFTSEEQLRYALRVRKESARSYAVAKLPGATLFQILAGQPLPVVMNPHSEMGEAVFETEAVKNLGDGSILKPLKNAGEQGNDEGGYSAQLTILDVADRPTKLVQPVFEYIGQHDIFRAAWVFGNGLPETWDRRSYHLAFWMERRDEEIEQGLGVVLMAVQNADLKCEVVVMGTEEKERHEWTRHVPPFFQRS